MRFLDRKDQSSRKDPREGQKIGWYSPHPYLLSTLSLFLFFSLFFYPSLLLLDFVLVISSGLVDSTQHDISQTRRDRHNFTSRRVESPLASFLFTISCTCLSFSVYVCVRVCCGCVCVCVYVCLYMSIVFRNINGREWKKTNPVMRIPTICNSLLKKPSFFFHPLPLFLRNAHVLSLSVSRFFFHYSFSFFYLLFYFFNYVIIRD